MGKTKKPDAASRTVDMFTGRSAVDDSVPQEPEERNERADRAPLEQDLDSLRDNAFKVQEWTTKFFGKPEAGPSEFRVTKRGEYYYLERVLKTPGTKDAYGYTGVILHSADLEPVVKLLVQAYRETK